MLDKLKPEQVKRGETVFISYEPGKSITLRKAGVNFRVLTSNEKKIQVDDEVKFVVAGDYVTLVFQR